MTEQERGNGQRNDSDPTDEQIVVPEVTEIAIPEHEIRVPAGMADDETGKMKDRARELVEQIEQTDGSKQMAAIDNISNTGIQTQRIAGKELNLLRGRVGDMMTGPYGHPRRGCARQCVCFGGRHFRL